MSAGHYRQTAAFRRSQKQAKKDFDSLIGILALPFAIILLPLKWIFGLGKK